LIIAATALETGRALVTGNTAHFGWIPALTIEDWRYRAWRGPESVCVGRSDRFAVPRSARLGKRGLLFQPQSGRDPTARVGARRRPGFAGVTNSARGLKGRDSSGAHLRLISRSRPAGKENFRSRTAPSLPGSPGNTSRLRKTTKSSAVANHSWPALP
jgi:hypothetical protein